MMTDAMTNFPKDAAQTIDEKTKARVLYSPGAMFRQVADAVLLADGAFGWPDQVGPRTYLVDRWNHDARALLMTIETDVHFPGERVVQVPQPIRSYNVRLDSYEQPLPIEAVVRDESRGRTEHVTHQLIVASQQAFEWFEWPDQDRTGYELFARTMAGLPLDGCGAPTMNPRGKSRVAMVVGDWCSCMWRLVGSTPPASRG